MFEYGPTAIAESGRAPPGARTAAGASRSALPVVAAARNRKTLVLSAAVVCGLLGLTAAKTLPPRYVATTQIYIDPGSLTSAEKDVLAPGQDSTGFINYVESQTLIILSRAVLERVVANEKLDADPTFGASSLFPEFSDPAPGDRVEGAVTTLGQRIKVQRPERTFVLDLKVSDRDPLRAARLANAVAKAYIEVSTSLKMDASRQSEGLLSGKLEPLRLRVRDAEKAIEDYRAEKGLVGARDMLVVEQELKEVTAQISLARTRKEEARALRDKIGDMRRSGGADVAAVASQTLSASLTALRTQQATTRQRLADLLSELGPLHPSLIDAKARVRAADAAVDAELARFARNQRIEYERASQLEASLTARLDALKKQTLDDGQSGVGLRDLEREAEAARSEYELFVKKSRETGDIQGTEPTRTRIISLATAPKARVFPPSAALMALAGSLAGLVLGLAAACWREGVFSGPGGAPNAPLRPETRSPRAAVAPTSARFKITSRTELVTRPSIRSLAHVNLRKLGFATLARDADGAEFAAILDRLRLSHDNERAGARPFSIAVLGSNRSGLRSALAINLALCARRRGSRVALVDLAQGRNNLTQATEAAMAPPGLGGGPFFVSDEDILVALPDAINEERDRKSPAEILEMLMRLPKTSVEIIVADGPDLDDVDFADGLKSFDHVVACDDEGAKTAALERALEKIGLGVSAYVRFSAAQSASDAAVQARTKMSAPGARGTQSRAASARA